MTVAKQQHYIPQFLLKGFACRQTPKETYTFLFRQNAEPLPANIRDVGQQRYFHGKPSESDLEDRLQREEGRFASLTDELRTGKPPGQATEAVRQLVGNLAIRTRHLRQGFANATEEFMAALDRALEGMPAAKFAQLARRGLRQDPSKAKLLSRLPRGMEHQFGPYAKNQFRGFFRTMLGKLDLNRIAARGQMNALSKSLETGHDVPRLAALRWTVDRRDSVSWVLGDVVCLAKSGSDLFFRNLFASPGDYAVVVMPIASNAVLVGHPTDSPPLLDADEVNQASAELSREFFVAHQNTQRETLYHARLGLRSEFITLAEMDHMCQQMLDEFCKC